MEQTIFLIKDLGLTDYQLTWSAMKEFVQEAISSNLNEPGQLWLVEHHPVYTLGQSCSQPEFLATPNIPVVSTDRGGQITYHGPGQLIIYLLVNIRALKLGIKQLVYLIEQSIIETLESFDLQHAHRRDHAPGVYIADEKIASLGLRVKHGWTYHGLSFNVDMDLQPFSIIHPCGFKGLQMTQLKNWLEHVNIDEVKTCLIKHLTYNIGKSVNGNFS